MQFIKHLFASLTPSFLIRNYVFGACFWALCVLMPPDVPALFVVALTINLIFFPFATLVWDEIRDTMMGSTMIIMPLWILLFIKLVIKMFIFCFAIPVGILGIAYIWFRTKGAKQEQLFILQQPIAKVFYPLLEDIFACAKGGVRQACVALYAGVNNIVIFSQAWRFNLTYIVAGKAVFSTTAHINLCHFSFSMAGFALQHWGVAYVIFIIQRCVAALTIPCAGKQPTTHKA